MKNIIIGLTGRFGAGCTTAYDLLTTEEKFKGFSLSKYLKILAINDEKYKKLNIKKQRTYLQDLGDSLREEHGQNYLAKKVIEEINGSNNQNTIVVDSFKNPAEINEFRNEYSNFYLLAIDSSTKERWNRTKEYYEEDEEVFKKDDERDKGTNKFPYKGQQVDVCMRSSDILINSDKSFYNHDKTININAVEEYGQKINGYIKLIKRPGSRGPSLDELYMHQACSNSLRSQCLKRQVGAIIVVDNKIGSFLIASGTNNVPTGETDCRGQKNCYRDTKKEEMIKKIKYCPNCGNKNSINKNKKCNKCGEEIYIPKMLDYCKAVHAEEQAILQAAILGTSVEGTTIYTSTHPCLLCSKIIINCGIKNVVYFESYPVLESIEMLEKCGINRRKFEGVTSRVFNKVFLEDILN